jgi:hypothetical protein
MGPPKSAAKHTTDPIAIPAVIPFSFDPVATFRITNIKKKVSTASKAKATGTPYAG